MPSLSLHLTYSNTTQTTFSEKSALDAVQAFLASLDQTGSFALDLTITGPEEIRIKNKAFRHVDAATDVLSFPVENIANNPTVPRLLGLILVCPAVVKEHWHEGQYGAILEDQGMIYVLCHGLMHLLGHDHVSDTENTTFEKPINRFIKEYYT